MSSALERALPPSAAGPQSARPIRKVAWILFGIAALLILAVGITGRRHLRREEARIREAAEEMLAAVADLKVAQVARWRKERLADAVYIRRTPYAARRALDALADDSEVTRRMFTGWLDAVMASEPYRRALLLDAQFNVRMVHPPKASDALSDSMRAQAELALRTQEVTVTALHRDGAADLIHMDFLIPLVVRREGNRVNVPAAGLPASTNDHSAGVLILEINASEFLFPLMEKWPTPSRTAETLLVRRDGDEVLFLNDLRHRKGAGLSLRFPLSQLTLPAAQAIAGHVGTVAGIDYRGIPVLGAVRPVPDTPWFIVAKVDWNEIHAPLRQQNLMTALLVGLFVLTAILGVGLMWRQEALASSRRELTEHQRAEAALARQTQELREHNEELTRFNRAAVGRELRMVELKREVDELCGRLGEPPRYNTAAEEH